MNYVKHLNIGGVEAKEIPCICGAGAPTTATEGAVGCFYMDTTTGEVYKCTSASVGAYTWEILRTYTQEDKDEFAEYIATELAKRGQAAPEYMDSYEKLKAEGDTSKLYVLPDGMFYAYRYCEVTSTETKTVEIKGGYETGRLSSGGALSGDVSTHTLTPYIDLTKSEYQGKEITIHLEGNRYASTTTETYIMCAAYQADANKTVILGRAYTMTSSGGVIDEFNGKGQKVSLVVNGQTSATLTLGIPLESDSGKTVGYMRFCGLGTVHDSVYITYEDQGTSTGYQWKSLDISIKPSMTDADKAEIAEQAAAIIDAELLSVIGSGEVSI